MADLQDISAAGVVLFSILAKRLCIGIKIEAMGDKV